MVVRLNEIPGPEAMISSCVDKIYTEISAMSKQVFLTMVAGMLLLLSVSCGSGDLRLGSHEIWSKKLKDDSLYLVVDGKGEKVMRFFDYEDDGVMDVFQIVHANEKRFVTIMGKDSSDVVIVTLGEDGSVHTGICNVVTKGSIYKCKWERERWAFTGNDGVEYYVKMYDQKYGHAIMPVKAHPNVK